MHPPSAHVQMLLDFFIIDQCYVNSISSSLII